MRLRPVALPSDLAAAHAMIMAERAARVKAEARATAVCSERDEARAEAANAQADLSSQEALIAHLKLAIEKLRRAIYGSSSHGSGSGEPKHLLPHKLPDPPGIIAV